MRKGKKSSQHEGARKTKDKTGEPGGKLEGKWQEESRERTGDEEVIKTTHNSCPPKISFWQR